MIFNSVVYPHKIVQPKVKICGDIEVGDLTVNTVISTDTPLEVEVVNESISVELSNEFGVGEQIWRTYTKTHNADFPSGAYYVDIQPLENGKPVTINGKDFYLGSKKSGNAVTNFATKKIDVVPAINIVSNGNGYIITIAYPSDSGLTNQGMDDLYNED